MQASNYGKYKPPNFILMIEAPAFYLVVRGRSSLIESHPCELHQVKARIAHRVVMPRAEVSGTVIYDRI